MSINKNLIIVIIAGVILILLAVLFYFYKNSEFNQHLDDMVKYSVNNNQNSVIRQEVVNRNQSDIKEVDIKEIKIENEENINFDKNLMQYRNGLLKISFLYPIEWGNVTAELNGSTHIALLAMNEVIAAANSGPSPARGAYWGDDAADIINQAYVNNLCQTKNDCQIKTNKNGIIFAKVMEDVYNFGLETTTLETNYYIFNPNSEFRGIIVSTNRLKEKNIPDLENKLDSLIDSLEFIK